MIFKKQQQILGLVFSCLVGLGCANAAQADTLISNAKVTGLFNGFDDLFDPALPYYDMYFQLTGGASPDVCPHGVHPYGADLWKILGPGDGSVNKAFVLLEAASVADMTITVEGTATPVLDGSSLPTGQCTSETIQYIVLHSTQI